MSQIELGIQPSATSADNGVSDSDDKVKKGSDFLDEQSSIEKLQTLRLLVKNMESIEDPVEASRARKECYSFYRMILEQMEPIEKLRIRENSKRVMIDFRRKTIFYLVSVSTSFVIFLTTLFVLTTGKPADYGFSGENLLSFILLTVTFLCIFLGVFPFFYEFHKEKK